MNNRTEGRTSSNKTGLIKFGAAGYQRPCSIIDLTPNGAGLTVASGFGIPEVFQMTIDGETKVRQCRVIWAQGGRLGVAFE
jgi:hypothetical protein